MVYTEFADIDDFLKWVEIKPIETGRSDDKKYYIQRTNGDEMLLRVNDISRYNKAKAAALFAYNVYERTGINMNVPIEVGACAGDTLVYTLYTWVNGEDAKEKIRNMHTPLQYGYGVMAGKLLRKVHTIKAPGDLPLWETYYSEKIDDYIMQYKALGVTFRGADSVLNYLRSNKHLLVNRPQTALHGDFYTGNLVLDDNGSIGIIDFNKWKWGDPYRDFHCIRLSGTKPFMKGQVDGYFEGKGVPADFFPLLALYQAVEAICGIIVAYSYGEEAVNEAKREAERIVRGYDSFEGLIPDWY